MVFKSFFRGKKLFSVRLKCSKYESTSLDNIPEPSNSIAVPKRRTTMNLILHTHDIREGWSEEELRLKEKAERENSWLVKMLLTI